jgi:hypothetical protein
MLIGILLRTFPEKCRKVLPLSHLSYLRQEYTYGSLEDGAIQHFLQVTVASAHHNVSVSGIHVASGFTLPAYGNKAHWEFYKEWSEVSGLSEPHWLRAF